MCTIFFWNGDISPSFRFNFQKNYTGESGFGRGKNLTCINYSNFEESISGGHAAAILNFVEKIELQKLINKMQTSIKMLEIDKTFEAEIYTCN